MKNGRPFWIIKGFLAKELAELGVRRGAKHLVTSPKEIAEHTRLDVTTVKKWLSRATGKKVDGRMVVIRVGKTDVVIRLAD